LYTPPGRRHPFAQPPAAVGPTAGGAHRTLPTTTHPSAQQTLPWRGEAQHRGQHARSQCAISLRDPARDRLVLALLLRSIVAAAAVAARGWKCFARISAACAVSVAWLRCTSINWATRFCRREQLVSAAVSILLRSQQEERRRRRRRTFVEAQRGRREMGNGQQWDSVLQGSNEQ
jgi:hypothetical protein